MRRDIRGYLVSFYNGRNYLKIENKEEKSMNYGKFSQKELGK